MHDVNTMGRNSAEIYTPIEVNWGIFSRSTVSFRLTLFMSNKTANIHKHKIHKVMKLI